MSTPGHLPIIDQNSLPLARADERQEAIGGVILPIAPEHWRHRLARDAVTEALTQWDDRTDLGITVPTARLMLGPADAVTPDVIWMRRDRAPSLLNDPGHLLSAPELVIEVLALDPASHHIDLKLKRDLYARAGAAEYWIVAWRTRTIYIFRRQLASLRPIAALKGSDQIASPLLPGFACPAAVLCTAPL